MKPLLGVLKLQKQFLSFYWVVFDLDAASTITLYDGDDNTAPLIGVYSGDDLQGQDVFSGVDNVTGCITVEFDFRTWKCWKFRSLCFLWLSLVIVLLQL